MNAPAVALRPYEMADIPRLYAAARESAGSVGPWLPWCHPGYSLDEAAGWVTAQVAAFATGTEYNFVIVSADAADAGRFLGGCALNQLDRVNRRANLGYWLRTSAVGRGVATAAVRQLLRWAFERTDLFRVEIVAAVGNRRSLRVAETVGARREGLSRSRLLVHGERHDAEIFSYLRSDPPP